MYILSYTCPKEKCQQQNKGLYFTFVGLTKALDSVSRTGLWPIRKRLGCPTNFPQMVNQMYRNQHIQIRLNGCPSKPFPITNGVKQGCVVVPTLCSMKLKQATDDLDDEDGVCVQMAASSIYGSCEPTPRPRRG